MPGIDFELSAHMRRAVEDRLLQRAAGATVDVLRREAALRLRDLRNRLVEIALFGAAAVEDRRLVEMDMRLDKAGRDETATEFDDRRIGGERRLDSHDLAAADADIDRRPAETSGNPSGPQDHIHRDLLCGGAAITTPSSPSCATHNSRTARASAANSGSWTIGRMRRASSGRASSS